MKTPFFAVSVIGFFIYLLYGASYYGLIAYAQLNYAKAASFFTLLIFFVFFLIKRISFSYLFVVIFFVLMLSAVGFFAGFYFDADASELIVHFVYLVFFAIASLIGFEYAKRLVVSDDNLTQLRRERNFWVSGLILSACFVVGVHLYRVADHNPSITFPFLLLALSFFWWREYKAYSIFTIILIFFTLKRGMWLAVLVMFCLVTLRQLLRLSVSRASMKASTIRSMILVCCAVISCAMLALIYPHSKIASNVLDRVGATFTVQADASSIDKVTSGRLGDFMAVHEKVTSDCTVLFGCGFGAKYNYFDYNPAWERTSSWIKSGSDVLPLHFYLLFGIFGVVMFFILMMFFAASCAYLLVSPKNSIVYYFSLLYVLLFSSNFVSFSFFDPLLPFSLGCIVAALMKSRAVGAGGYFSGYLLKGKG